jgi:hypothetical protein
MQSYYDAWWGKVPSRCACGKKMKLEVVDENTLHFTCPEHGLRVFGTKELKRKIEDWHYYRLSFSQSLTKGNRIVRLKLWD